MSVIWLFRWNFHLDQLNKLNYTIHCHIELSLKNAWKKIFKYLDKCAPKVRVYTRILINKENQTGKPTNIDVIFNLSSSLTYFIGKHLSHILNYTEHIFDIVCCVCCFSMPFPLSSTCFFFLLYINRHF